MTITNDLAVLAGGAGGVNTGGFMRNRIINGAMVIDQRNAGASVTPTTIGSTYTLDRWVATNAQSSKYSVQQSSTVPSGQGFSNSLLVTSLSAYTIGASDYFYMVQYVEGFNAADLMWGTSSALSATLSFWIRSSLTGTFVVAVRSGSDDAAYPATYTINAANTWEKKTITIPGPTTGTFGTTNGRGFGFWFSLGSGSNFNSTANVWGAGGALSVSGSQNIVANNGATWYLTGVQLEVGSVATPFEREIYSNTLAKCQRYLPSFSYAGGANPYIGSGMAGSTTSAYYVIPYMVRPRIPATGIFVSSASHFAGFLASTATSNSTGVTFGGSNDSAAFILLSGMSGLVAGNATMIYMSNSGALMYFTGCEL